jgi:hypothetical protein
MRTIGTIYIDGAFVMPHGDDRAPLFNPATEKQIGEVREGGGQIQIWGRKISVRRDRPSKPRDRLLVTSKVELRHSRGIHPDAFLSRGLRGRASRIRVSVSSARPMKILPKAILERAWARFRSHSNACSHSAMPSVARLVNTLMSPKFMWARAWCRKDSADRLLLP